MPLLMIGSRMRNGFNNLLSNDFIKIAETEKQDDAVVTRTYLDFLNRRPSDRNGLTDVKAFLTEPTYINMNNFYQHISSYSAHVTCTHYHIVYHNGHVDNGISVPQRQFSDVLSFHSVLMRRPMNIKLMAVESKYNSTV